VGIAHENGHKRKNDDFLVIGLVNHTKTSKLWAIAPENGHKYKNDEFWDMPLKHVVSVMGLVNHLGNPKELEIAHENGPKTQKR
jgi:hypothetical protein